MDRMVENSSAEARYSVFHSQRSDSTNDSHEFLHLTFGGPTVCCGPVFRKRYTVIVMMSVGGLKWDSVVTFAAVQSLEKIDRDRDMHL